MHYTSKIAVFYFVTMNSETWLVICQIRIDKIVDKLNNKMDLKRTRDIFEETCLFFHKKEE